VAAIHLARTGENRGEGVMELYRSIAEVPPAFGPSVVSIGKFDGMHAGHRRLIAELRSIAAARSLVATAVTFDRHPLALLRPELCPVALLSNEQKLELLGESGIDATLMLTFDRALSEQDPRDFVEQVLVGALHASVVLVGSDFRFGAKGAGTVALLQELGGKHGFEVQLIDDVVAPAGTSERRASSTWIRELLTSGDIPLATQLLGRAPSIRATVVGGEQRGRELGYPTANLSPEIEGFVPVDGVYAAHILIDGQRYGAAVSIGNNPTFEGVPDRQVEAHVLDQNFDLYGKRVQLEFIAYVRPMQKFPDAGALVTQMRRDEQTIRSILATAPAATGE
jgi:riboflavin kinase/FMN adenylyltransferase